MNLLSRNTLAMIAMSAIAPLVSAFVVRPSSLVVSTTTLFLQDWVADLIDQELYRQGHKKEYESAWMEKNRAAVLSRMESDFGPISDSPDESEFRMYNKDKRMAEEDPERYCADRCIATGNCDIYEDFYKLDPKDVIKFCTECVLSEEGECDLPDAFYDASQLTP